jgi:hypothetical protein
VSTPEFFATEFLTAVETGFAGIESPEYAADPRAARIAQALRAAGVEKASILGAGSFGIAAAMQDGRVVKLTSDESEVAAGSVLKGQRLTHVARIDGSWFVRGVEVQHWELRSTTRSGMRAGILISERVAPIDYKSGQGQAITDIHRAVRARYGASPESLAEMTHAEARKMLRLASRELERRLRDLADEASDPIARAVANALRELRSHGVYSIDVHAGNIGYSHEGGVFKVFDIGSSSSPPGAQTPELPHGTARTMPRSGNVREGVAVEEIGEEAPHKRLTRRDCRHIQKWLFDYLSTDVDPYDFNFAIPTWIEQEGVTDDGVPYTEPTDVTPEDLSPEMLKAFTAWLKKSGEMELYTREMPLAAPAYLTLHAESKPQRGTWFVHFTNRDFVGGFTYGSTLDGLQLTTWKNRKDLANCANNLSKGGALAEVVFGFAFAIDDLSNWKEIRYAVKKYGKNAALFQCDCAVRAYHDGDQEHQVIFPVCSEYNLHMISIDAGGYPSVWIEADGDDREFESINEVVVFLEGASQSSHSASEDAVRTFSGHVEWTQSDRSWIGQGNVTGDEYVVEPVVVRGKLRWSAFVFERGKKVPIVQRVPDAEYAMVAVDHREAGTGEWSVHESGERSPEQLSKLPDPELEEIPTPELDRAAFGFTSGSIVEIPIDKIEIKYTGDYDAAWAELHHDRRKVRSYLKSAEREPVDVSLWHGVYYLEDGHHRYLAAKLSGKKTIRAVVDIKDNPITELRRKYPQGGAREDVIPVDYEFIEAMAVKVAERFARLLGRVELNEQYFRDHADNIRGGVVQGAPEKQFEYFDPFEDTDRRMDLRTVRGKHIDRINVIPTLVWSDPDLPIVLGAATQGAPRGVANIWVRVNAASRYAPDLRDHPGAFARQFASTLLHEVTHIRDYIRPQDVVDPDKNPSPERYEQYFNSPHEVRARIAQIVYEVRYYFGTAVGRRDLENARLVRDNPNEWLMEMALGHSRTWLGAEYKLTPENREKVYRAVYRAMQRERFVVEDQPPRIPKTAQEASTASAWPRCLSH